MPCYVTPSSIGDNRKNMAQSMSVESKEKAYLKKRLIAIGLSFVIGSALMGLKFYVYWITGSSAILSDALESIINVVASAFAMWSIFLASKPPDPTHPYGHGKIEYFSAGFEGALIIFAAVAIVHRALPQILHPHELPALGLGLLILFGTSLVNVVLGMGLLRVGRKTRSLALIADGKHILTDVYTSAGVLLGLLLVDWTHWYWLDGAIACLVALNILVIGAKLVRESFAGLMDASDPALLEEISRVINEHRNSLWIDIHRLRAWRSGNRLNVDFHLILPRNLTLEEAHEEVMKLQGALAAHLGDTADALIHAEPCIDPECPICAYDPCNLRREPVRRQRIWCRDILTSHLEEENRSFRSDLKDDSEDQEKETHT
jgi:cation diffusion facilitator family transporter